MKPVFQTSVHKGEGDCQRAVIASLLELEAEQVPNFILFSRREWWFVLFYFLYALGWDLIGCVNSPVDLSDEDGIGGYHYASVPSATFGGDVTHAVVIDGEGNVAHDPNPNQLWAGRNIFDNDAVECVYLIRKRTEGAENE